MQTAFSCRRRLEPFFMARSAARGTQAQARMIQIAMPENIIWLLEQKCDINQGLLSEAG